MNIDVEKTGGISAIAGALIFAFLLALAMASYPNYSPLSNYLSDLGVYAQSSFFFNFGCIIAGLAYALLSLGLYSRFRGSLNKFASLMFFSGSISLILVGIFTKNYSIAHAIVSSMFFILSGITASIIGRIFWKKDLLYSLLSFVVPVFVTIFLVFNEFPIFEHFAVLFAMLWSFAMGAYLLRKK